MVSGKFGSTEAGKIDPDKKRKKPKPKQLKHHSKVDKQGEK